MRIVAPKFLLVLAAVWALAWPSASSADTLNLAGADPSLCTGGCGGADLGGGYWSYAGLIWSITDEQPTGSGYIDSFLRIGSNQDVVDGMNTDGAFLNEELPKTNHTFTHSVVLGDIGTVDFDADGANGAYSEESYYKFLLDINQTGADPLLSLSGLQFCTSSSSTESFVDTCAGGGSTLEYDLDGNTSTPYATGSTGDPLNSVLLDYSLNSGSGSGDLFVYVPTSYFEGLDPDETYLYLWSQFGRPKDVAPNNDGYEEWAFENVGGGGGGGEEPLPGVPEPASLVLLGSGLVFGAAAIRRRAKRQQTAENSAA